MIYIDGSTYTGSWYNNLRHGQGTYEYINGDKYVGEWQNDNKQGQGSYIYNIDNSIYSGIWSNNVCYNGEWTYYDQYQTCTAIVKDNHIVKYIKT